MKRHLVLLLIGMTALSNAFAGSLYLLNKSNRTIFLAYTVKTKSGTLLTGDLYNTPHTSPTGVGIGGDPAYQVNSLTEEGKFPLQCIGLELNKFYSDVRLSFNVDGACTAETTD